jgi:predicted ribosomally synthesized peptide with SipW-like signal peptide
MKKILLSIVLIGIVSVGAFAATQSAFTDNKTIPDNVFATGTVKLGNVFNFPINAPNLKPGEWTDWMTVGVNYDGSLNANLWLGVGGCLPDTHSKYIADKLQVQIRQHGTTDIFFNNKAKWLSSNWLRIAQNTGRGNHWYDVRFMLDDVDNTYQGIQNVDTVFIIHAVQTGTPQPGLEPYKYLMELDIGNETYTAFCSRVYASRRVSSVLSYSSTGWAGWSCPENTKAVAGGYMAPDGSTPTNPVSNYGLAVPGAVIGGSVYPNFPHYTFKAGETGFVLQNGDVAQQLILWVDCK